MNRRSFLKAFTGGVVGAGVVAALPKSAPRYVLNKDQFVLLNSIALRLREEQFQYNKLLRAYNEHMMRLWIARPTRD